jgi:hypothetical protein
LLTPLQGEGIVRERERVACGMVKKGIRAELLIIAAGPAIESSRSAADAVLASSTGDARRVDVTARAQARAIKFTLHQESNTSHPCRITISTARGASACAVAVNYRSAAHFSFWG